MPLAFCGQCFHTLPGPVRTDWGLWLDACKLLHSFPIEAKQGAATILFDSSFHRLFFFLFPVNKFQEHCSMLPKAPHVTRINGGECTYISFSQIIPVYLFIYLRLQDVVSDTHHSHKTNNMGHSGALVTSETFSIEFPNQLPYFPAIIGRFQENSHWSDYRMPFGSLIVSECLAVEDYWKQRRSANERSKDHK